MAGSRFVGKWKLHSSDNFDEYMKAVGIDDFLQLNNQRLLSKAPQKPCGINRSPSRRISRRPKKNCGLAAGKIAASRQPGRKINAAKPPPKIRLKAALPRDVNEKLAIIVYCSYEHAVKLQCCTKIGKSEKIILLELCGW